MQMNKTSLFNGGKIHVNIIGYILLIVILTTLSISCSSNSTGEEPEDEDSGEIPESGLFLSVGGDTNGLHVVDIRRLLKHSGLVMAKPVQKKKAWV